MWKKLFRYRKLQNFLLFLVILFCSLLLTASFGILNNLEQPFDSFIKQCGSGEMMVYPYNNSSTVKIADDLMKLEGVQRTEILTRHYVNEEMQAKGKKIDVFTNLVIDHGAISGHCIYLEGNYEDARGLKEGECIIPACIGNQYDLHIDDMFDVLFPNQTVSYRIAGIYSDPYSCSTSFDSNIIVSSIPDSAACTDFIMVDAKDGISAATIVSDYRKLHDGLFPARTNTVEDMKEDNTMVGKIIGSIFLAIGIIMLLVSCLIINYMVRSLMITDAKTIAVYKTIGRTSNEILLMYLKFFFSIVCAGSLSGILGSSVVTNTVLNMVYSNIGKSAKANIWTAGLPCFIGISLLVMGIVFAIMNKSKKIRPVTAIVGEGATNTKKYRLRKGSPVGFSPLGIAIRNMRSDKKEVAGILIIAIMTIMSVNFGMISLDLANTMRNHNDYWLGIEKCDVMITINDASDYDAVIQKLDTDPEIESYSSCKLGYLMEGEWKESISNPIINAFVYQDYNNQELSVIEGRNPSAADEIAITTVLANMYGKEVGDYITITMDQGQKVDLLITGLYQTYFNLGHSCRITKDMITRNGGNVNYDTISIYLKEGVNPDEYLKKIKESIKNLGNVCLRTDALSSIMDMIVEPQKKAIPLIIGLVFLIGGINIFAVIMLRNVRCERQNGIYKSIGYTSGHLIKSNAAYVMILAAVSMVIAIPLNLLTYEPIMKTALSMFGFRQYPVTMNIAHLVIINLTVLIVFYLSAIISSLPIRRIEVRELIVE